mmetsp:Transcript_35434/g.102048  ORF Transcript_35434/g.102048 Transcript_35434/m.102048 type:complete len:312 (+) Transcript_35434:577-1512(+)
MDNVLLVEITDAPQQIDEDRKALVERHLHERPTSPREVVVQRAVCRNRQEVRRICKLLATEEGHDVTRGAEPPEHVRLVPRLLVPAPRDLELNPASHGREAPAGEDCEAGSPVSFPHAVPVHHVDPLLGHLRRVERRPDARGHLRDQLPRHRSAEHEAVEHRVRPEHSRVVHPRGRLVHAGGDGVPHTGAVTEGVAEKDGAAGPLEADKRRIGHQRRLTNTGPLQGGSERHQRQRADERKLRPIRFLQQGRRRGRGLDGALRRRSGPVLQLSDPIRSAPAEPSGAKAAEEDGHSRSCTEDQAPPDAESHMT